MQPESQSVSGAAPLGEDEVERLMYALEDRLAALITSPRSTGLFADGAREEAERVCTDAFAGREVSLETVSEDGLLFLLSLVCRFWIELGRGTAILTPPPGHEPALALLWQIVLDPSRPN